MSRIEPPHDVSDAFVHDFEECFTPLAETFRLPDGSPDMRRVKLLAQCVTDAYEVMATYASAATFLPPDETS